MQIHFHSCNADGPDARGDRKSTCSAIGTRLKVFQDRSDGMSPTFSHNLGTRVNFGGVSVQTCEVKQKQPPFNLLQPGGVALTQLGISLSPFFSVKVGTQKLYKFRLMFSSFWRKVISQLLRVSSAQSLREPIRESWTLHWPRHAPCAGALPHVGRQPLPGA